MVNSNSKLAGHYQTKMVNEKHLAGDECFRKHNKIVDEKR